jgi:hypothetical protein
MQKLLVTTAALVATISPALAQTSGGSDASAGLLLLLLISGAVYFLPAIVAWKRYHRNRLAIVVLNVLLGWTLVGWVVAIVWACTADVDVDLRPARKPPIKFVDRWSTPSEIEAARASNRMREGHQ